MPTYYNRIYWSIAGDPEDLSGADAGYFPDINNDGGGITGVETLENYFFVFQEKAYSVFAYQAVVGEPLAQIKQFGYGCNSNRSIVEIESVLYYLSDNGEIRRTNGLSDVSISTKIFPLASTITNNRTVKDYYSGAAYNLIPNAFYDRQNNAYRLFYAGNSDYNDKCLSYFIKQDIFTTASNINAAASVNAFGYTEYFGVIGNSDASGITYAFVPNYSDYAKTGTLDLGWMFSGNPLKKIKVYSIDIYFHAEAGQASATDCDATISIAVYKNPANSSAAKTLTTNLAYNDFADNLQKKKLLVNLTADYVRFVLTDSGDYKNYSIDKIIINFDAMDTPS